MKNTKTSSIILAVLSIVSIILETVDLVPFGWSLDAIGQITAVVAMIKIIIENTSLFNEKQLVSFGNFVMKQDVYKSENVKGQVTHADLSNWKLENEAE